MRLFLFSVSLALTPWALFSQSVELFIYPVTRTVQVTDNYFGKNVADPYRWLENDTSAETMAWAQAQSQFALNYLKKNANIGTAHSQITNIRDYRYENSFYHRGYYFYYAYSSNEKTTDLYYKRTIDGMADILITSKRYGKNKDIESISLSKDSKTLAFQISESGSDWREIHIKNMANQKDFPEVLKGVKFSNIAWKGNGFYYCRYDQPEKGKLLTAVNEFPEIYYHHLGEAQSQDKLIYKEELISNEHPSFDTSSDERFLVVVTHEVKKERAYAKVLYLDLMDSIRNFRECLRIPSAKIAFINSEGDDLFFQSFYHAPSGQIIKVKLKEGYYSTQEVVTPYKEPLEKTSIINHKLVCVYKGIGNYIAIVFDLQGKALHKIDFPTGYGVSGFNGEPADKNTIYRITSFTFPRIVYQYNLDTFEIELVSQTTISYDHSEFEVKVDKYSSKDGTLVPIFIVKKKKLKLNGNTPCLIYGYGGFGISLSPFFDPGLIYFLGRGGIFAAPCIRGGGELGEDWHKAGQALKKQNSFDDFIAAAEYMISSGYTNPSKLAIMGGSNGGLLVGAAMTQRPDLFRAVVAQVGVFDMLRYQNFTIGNAWISEYGSSNDSIQFNNLIKYSPLHNLADKNYPATLIITGDHDDRVPPLHSYKFASALQERNRSSHPILLLTNKNAGHHGPSAYYEGLLEMDYVYGFILHELKQ